MAWSLAIDTTSWWQAMSAFQKTLTRTPVTKTTDNVTGDETLTDGTTSTVYGVFFKKDDQRMLHKYGQLIEDADAVLMVKPTVTLNRDDKITYNSEVFRVDQVVQRHLAGTHFYNAYQLFRIT